MSILAARPVRRLHPPVYPTRLEVLANPEVLRRNLPVSGLFRGESVPLAAALMAVGLGGCTDADPSPEARRKAALERVAAAAIVAPIFEHGEGRGATGCVVVAAPVFLSEEEALQVVREELCLAGLTITESGVPMEGVWIPQFEWQPSTDWVSGNYDWRRAEVPTRVPLELDLKDSQLEVAIEYVCSDDALALDASGGQSTVESYDTRESAFRVAQQVRKNGKGSYVGVFYDPMPDVRTLGPDPVDRELRDLYRSVATYFDSKDEVPLQQCMARIQELRSFEPKRLLRQQVRDFVEWLKGQGVI